MSTCAPQPLLVTHETVRPREILSRVGARPVHLSPEEGRCKVYAEGLCLRKLGFQVWRSIPKKVNNGVFAHAHTCPHMFTHVHTCAHHSSRSPSTRSWRSFSAFLTSSRSMVCSRSSSVTQYVLGSGTSSSSSSPSSPSSSRNVPRIRYSCW